ncbi:molybdopterin-dependent oxidoreductase [Adlercreutzia equolifaciens]|uniref:molybdopterin-dependent oxidoreductase n=1 Tax=Adlercreutzia equolifaciens TaxID=446660 RepID=UPI0023AE8CBA|nr:molybdopterin-dependent oxidoreductase [Adlercreutzia equolifaciens]MDE8702477.1 molybdopterin-dependent oxidoreductase [Adlercreutzia equolifaciens]
MSKSRMMPVQSGLTRRGFLKGSAAGALAAGSLSSLAACAPQTSGDSLAETGEKAPVDEGTWIAAACWDNCGGRCVNRVLVRDGEIVRQGSETSHEDSFGWLQQRGCPRGRARAQQVFGEDRVKYPMKRKNWQPGGGENAHGELRGKDEWEQITWEEAIDYIAQEAERIYGTYGPTAVIGTKALAVGKILHQLGGHVSLSDTSSIGTYAFNIGALGLASSDLGFLNDRYDNKNAETIVIMGGNPAWSSGGSTMNNFNEAKDAGVQFVYVGPSYNATAAYFEARWVPVLPGTDTAFMLGVCYEMIAADVVDYDFLDKCCVGFDDDHMPGDAASKESFRGYLMGDYDGTPKTAEWASPLCGTSPEDIRWFAETIGKDHAVMLMHNYALARCASADNVPQLFMTMGAMGGHMGKSGHACGGAYKTYAGAGGPELVSFGDTGLPGTSNPLKDTMPEPLMWQCILEGRYNSTGLAYGTEFNAEDIKEADFKWLNIEGRNTLQTAVGTTDAMEALQKLDLVTDLAYSFDSSARYADIVLPCATEWERVGGFAGHQRSRETVVVYSQVTEPLWEAKTEFEIGRMLAARLGMNPDELWPISEKQAFFNQIAGCTYVDTTGASQPLVTITDEDIASWGVEGAAQKGDIALADFLEAGCYTIKREEGDAYSYIGYEDFVADPEANPLPSASGKFEIYCQYKADTLNAMGYSPEGAFKPYPTYVEAPEGREGMFADRKIGGEASEYPFIVYNPHYLRRAHGVFDGVGWLREAWVNPVFLNASDAAAKGVADGDTVRVFSAHGATLRTASVSEIIMPGCVGLPHGAWVNYDEDEGIDRAGTDNVLCGSVTSGMGTSGYNNYNCNFEKYEGEALVPDCELPQRVVELV